MTDAWRVIHADFARLAGLWRLRHLVPDVDHTDHSEYRAAVGCYLAARVATMFDRDLGGIHPPILRAADLDVTPPWAWGLLCTAWEEILVAWEGVVIPFELPFDTARRTLWAIRWFVREKASDADNDSDMDVEVSDVASLLEKCRCRRSPDPRVCRTQEDVHLDI